MILARSLTASLPVLCFRCFSSQFCIGEALAYYLRYCQRKAICVIQRIVFCCTVIVAEYLLCDVAVKVERLYAHIRASQSALEQCPEILDSLSVDVSRTYSSM